MLFNYAASIFIANWFQASNCLPHCDCNDMINLRSAKTLPWLNINLVPYFVGNHNDDIDYDIISLIITYLRQNKESTGKYIWLSNNCQHGAYNRWCDEWCHTALAELSSRNCKMSIFLVSVSSHTRLNQLNNQLRNSCQKNVSFSHKAILL